VASQSQNLPGRCAGETDDGSSLSVDGINLIECGGCAGHVDEEVLEEVAATPDAGVASLGNVGGARARLLDAQESLRRQLQAQVGTVVSCMLQNALWLLRVLWEDSMNRMVSGNMRVWQG
jgi:hypothetical protein